MLVLLLVPSRVLGVAVPSRVLVVICFSVDFCEGRVLGGRVLGRVRR